MHADIFLWPRGTLTNSRLGNYFPERVIALAFISLGYLPPLFTANFAALSAATNAAAGFDVRCNASTINK